MDQKSLYANLRRTRKLLLQFNEDLPDRDAYAIPYCYIAQLIEKLDETIKELPQAMSNAKKEDTSDDINRAKAFYPFEKKKP